MLYENLDINEYGHLTISGSDATELADRYGTPLYVLDEQVVRTNCRKYIEAMHRHFGPDAQPLYASKALSFKGIYPIIESEGMAVDAVSPGEIYTALAAGFPAERIMFHGTNKTDEDIRYALESGVGYFVVDNFNELEILNRVASVVLGDDELEALNRMTGDTNREEEICKNNLRGKQKVLLRLTVGLDPHTLAAISTGKVDSQFGIPIDTGQAAEFVKAALECENLEVSGFHSHVGSQIFESESFIRQAEILVRFASEMREETGYTARILNIGGGFGVRYTEEDPVIDIDARIGEIAEHLRAACERFDYPMPVICMEPGRSIVADAGVTLYTCGGTKEVKGYRNYITVDGGMADNPRFALYGSRYTVLNASRAGDPADYVCTVAGRACESGDRLAEDIAIARPCRGDIIAVLTTGAYNYSMASNYNRLPRPAMVMISPASDPESTPGAKDRRGIAATDRLVIQRETYADLIKNEL